MSILNHNYVRDEESGAAINTNINELAKYRAARDEKNNSKKRLSEIETTLKTIVADINNIHSTIKEIARARS